MYEKQEEQRDWSAAQSSQATETEGNSYRELHQQIEETQIQIEGKRIPESVT